MTRIHQTIDPPLPEDGWEMEPLPPHEQDDPDLAVTYPPADMNNALANTAIAPTPGQSAPGAWAWPAQRTPSSLATLCADPEPVVSAHGDRVLLEMRGGAETIYAVNNTGAPYLGVGKSRFSFTKEQAQQMALLLMKTAAELD